MPSDTKRRLIDTATKRFYRDGFRNVGLDQILRDVGISKTAFYKHFSCKEDLIIAALKDHDDQFQDVFRQRVEALGGPDPVRQLHAVMDVAEEVIHSEDFHGCIFVNAAMEFPLPHDPTHEAAASNKVAIERIVQEIAARAGAADPAKLAGELCLIVEGAYVTYTVTCNAQTVQIAKGVAHQVIDAHLSRPKKRRSKGGRVVRKARAGKARTRPGRRA